MGHIRRQLPSRGSIVFIEEDLIADIEGVRQVRFSGNPLQHGIGPNAVVDFHVILIKYTPEKGG